MTPPRDTLLDPAPRLPNVSMPIEPLDGEEHLLAQLDSKIEALCAETEWDREELANYIGCKHPTAAAMKKLSAEELDTSLKAVTLMVGRVGLCGADDSPRVLRAAKSGSSAREKVVTRRNCLELVREALVMTEGNATLVSRVFSELRERPEQLVDNDQLGSAHRMIRRALKIALDPDSVWTDEDGRRKGLRLTGEEVRLRSIAELRELLDDESPGIDA